MKKLPIFLCSVFLLGTSFYSNKIINIKKETSPETSKMIKLDRAESKSMTAESIYNSISFEGNDVLDFDVFDKAFRGFQNLKKSGALDDDAKLLSVCDFSLSSTKKRLWVIDMDSKTVVFNTLVAHGKATGEEFATRFSNTESSHQSSLGFYITESTYNGGNGYSLRLIGMDKGYNDAAMKRAIVMHGADYVSEDFIKNQKRLGRSWGCPAVSRDLAAPIIDKIKDKTCLFIYYPDQNYLSSSQWLKNSEMLPSEILSMK
ncbi:murein L,D-transpeptidase catalytic domain family protein [Chryseobacterium sp. POL2]|uniref:murein L,D-transpeptidase catalytic domain family protein n=1 Tax=Chryseobacterium sp. POL2 TaxID=2713414 RepID=UPI0013E1AA16|nr:murein L,D-transpeptidase catalytic domain family protein [Chryseobacterium sp. POL2]QIG90150.1 murein L,D-transpeptidase catalytic domain family protein [Chryseobacterium sp. POL2]